MARTDYELLVEAKDGDSSSKFELWERYEALIHKTFNQSQPFFHAMGLEREDFVQEAYLQFDYSVQRFNPSKVTEPEGYLFYSYFRFALMKIKNKVEGEYRRFGVTIPVSHLTPPENSAASQYGTSEYFRDFEQRTAVRFDSELEKESSRLVVREYLGSVPEDVKEILELFMADISIAKIARLLGRGYSETYRIIRQSKKELEANYLVSALC